MSELLRLKAILSLKKFEENAPKGWPFELWGIGVFLLTTPVALFAFAVLSWIPETYLFEVLAFFYATTYLSWTLAPLSGGSLVEFLDFRALLLYPVSHRKLFFASVVSSLMDPSVMASYTMIWGVSCSLAFLYGWALLPLFLIVNLLFLIFCIASSQVVTFIYQFYLRKSRWFGFLITFIGPVLVFLLLIFGYSSVVMSLPFFDTFTSPDIPLLANSWWLPSSFFVLTLKNLCFPELSLLWLKSFSLVFLESLLLLTLGMSLVGRIQRGEDSNLRRKVKPSIVFRVLEWLLEKLLGGMKTVQYLVIKEWRLYLREPYTKATVVIPLMLAGLVYAISVSFAVVNEQIMLHGGMILHGRDAAAPQAIFEVSTVIYSWPVFFYSGLFIVASNFSSNIFGIERNGVNQLFLFPLPGWQMFFAKNLAVLLFMAVPAILVSVLALVFSWHSFHTLQMVFLYFILSLFLLFVTGNLMSVYFPLRLESSLGAALQRESFSRLFLMGLTRFFLGSLNGIFVLPVFLFCVYPMVANPNYVTPFLQLESYQWSSLLQSFFQTSFHHGIFLLYALGGYTVGLMYCSRVLSSRKESILRELNRLSR